MNIQRMTLLALQGVLTGAILTGCSDGETYGRTNIKGAQNNVASPGEGPSAEAPVAGSQGVAGVPTHEGHR